MPAIIPNPLDGGIGCEIVHLLAGLDHLLQTPPGAGARVEFGALKAEAILHRNAERATQRIQPEKRVAANRETLPIALAE